GCLPKLLLGGRRGKGRYRGWFSADRRQHHRQSGWRDRRGSQDRSRRAIGACLRPRRHRVRQEDDLRFRAPPPHRALRPDHEPHRRDPAAVRSAHGIAAIGNSMSDGGLLVLCFLLSLSGCIFIIWRSLRAVKRGVTRWDPNSYTWFVMSFGSFGQRQTENWKRWGGYDQDQAKIIIKYQALCWLGMILWVLACMALVMGYKALTYEDRQEISQHSDTTAPQAA